MAVAARKIAIAIAATILAVAAIWYAFRISTFNSLSDSDAKWWLSASEKLLLYATAALIIGLIGEWTDLESWKKTGAYKFAKLAVIIGVVGELLGDAGIFESSSRVQLLSDHKVNQATGRALRAQLAILKILEPRNLSDKAITRIIDKLKPLGPQPFTFSVTLAMEEGSDLPKQLGVLLIKDCGWEMQRMPGAMLYKGISGIGVTLGSGVIVSYDENNEVLKGAAKKLIEALADEGIATADEPENPKNPTDDKNVIQIAVGTKPLFLREIESIFPLPSK